jgi:hypothetical protein
MQEQIMTHTRTALLIVDAYGRAAPADATGRAAEALVGQPIFTLLGIRDEITRARLKRAIAAAVTVGASSDVVVGAGTAAKRKLTVRPAREAGHAVIGLGEIGPSGGAERHIGSDNRP